MGMGVCIKMLRVKLINRCDINKLVDFISDLDIDIFEILIDTNKVLILYKEVLNENNLSDVKKCKW